MATRSPYDEIAGWYEHEFLPTQRVAGDGTEDPLGIAAALDQLVGSGDGSCLEIGCGTGTHAAQLAALGWPPVGVDLSPAMLDFARDRVPVALGDAERLPIRDGSLDLVAAIMVHTDMPRYATVLAEASRVVRNGGVLVHVGVHPCFCGGFADRSDPDAIVIRPGYRDADWTTRSWTTQGVRDKVGASHWPLATLLNDVLSAGFIVEELVEGGQPTPVVLAFRARKPGFP